MKKLLILFLVLIFSITIYADYPRGVEAVTKTETELSEKFISEVGISLIDDYLVTYRELDSGEEINIIEEDDDYYYFKENDFLLFVDRNTVRTSEDEPFEAYKAYAVQDVNVYRDYKLTQAWYTLTYDTPVTVIDEYEDTMVIQLLDGSIVYLEAGAVKPRETTEKPTDSEDIRNTPDVSQDTSSETTEESSEDENVVVVIHSEEVPLSSPTKLKGKVRVNTPAYVTKLNRGDKLKVIDLLREDAVILINHTTVNIPIDDIWIRSMAPYIPWTGFLDDGQPIYEDFKLENVVRKATLNEEVTILGELDDLYIIEAEETDILFIEQENVAKMAKNASGSDLAPSVPTVVEPAVENTTENTPTEEGTEPEM